MNPVQTQKENTETTVQKHYQRLSEQYDQFLYYSPQFVRCLTSRMIETLRFKETDVFVDLACGTGMYAADILQQVRLAQPVIAVDPFAEMLARVPTDAPIKTVEMDALKFSGQPGVYDKVLIKEAVHHVDDKALLFENLFQRLRTQGRLLLVHVPPKLNYPLFEKALRRAEKWHADPDDLVRLLEQAGFRVERDAVDYPHSIPREKYFQMVENRYMSVLSSFGASEIEQGLAEMQGKYGDRQTLEFVDHFDYITAIKE